MVIKHLTIDICSGRKVNIRMMDNMLQKLVGPDDARM